MTTILAQADAVDEAGTSLVDMWNVFVDSLPRAGVALAIVGVAFGIGRLLRFVLRRRLIKLRSRSFAVVMSKLAGWVVTFLGALLALAVTFPSIRPVDLLGGVGLTSIAFAFAFQDILENLLSGVLLLFRQPFQAGDIVTVSEREGFVRGITIRETQIETFDGELILIPNRDVYKSDILVKTAFPRQRVSLEIGVAYDADLDHVEELILETVSGIDGVLDEPPSLVLTERLSTSTVDLIVHVWCVTERAIEVRDALVGAVKERMLAEGVELPSSIIELELSEETVDRLERYIERRSS